MRSKLGRLLGLLRRYRVDRRLPPPVAALYRTTMRLRAVDAWERASAAIRPISCAGPEEGRVCRLGARRVRTAGPIGAPFEALALEHAAAVEAALRATDVDSFVVDRSGDRLEIGVEHDARSAVLAALVAGLDADSWTLRWFDRERSGFVSLSRASRSRRVAVAREWHLTRLHAWGDRAVGPDFAVEVSFWELGTSGELERVGTRSHERFDPTSPTTTECVGDVAFRGRAAFPVSNTLERLHEPVDVVITWVDGSDPAWQAAFTASAHEVGRDIGADVALDPARYRSRDELRFVLRSLWAYCGWVRHIWIVTADQQPPFLCDHERVTVVPHESILPPSALPTFNSHAIEASLHRIDGLSEHFVYLNDDMFIGRSLRPETFFTPNGLAKVFQGGARVHGLEQPAMLAVDTAAIRGREVLAKHFGRVVTHKPLHAPYPLRRSTLCALEEVASDEFDRTRHSRFRAPSDLSVAASLGQHYGLALGASVLGSISSEYVHVESMRLPWHLDRIRLGDDLDTYCINETRDGLGRPDREARIAAFFAQVLPVGAPWERRD